eukprot:Rhum_TRINITY_DN14714_c19_g1::Rhum_TRINITY_DN14714_c19_g1_i1::g.113403::m.113403
MCMSFSEWHEPPCPDTFPRFSLLWGVLFCCPSSVIMLTFFLLQFIRIFFSRPFLVRPPGRLRKRRRWRRSCGCLLGRGDGEGGGKLRALILLTFFFSPPFLLSSRLSFRRKKERKNQRTIKVVASVDYSFAAVALLVLNGDRCIFCVSSPPSFTSRATGSCFASWYSERLQRCDSFGISSNTPASTRFFLNGQRPSYRNDAVSITTPVVPCMSAHAAITCRSASSSHAGVRSARSATVPATACARVPFAVAATNPFSIALLSLKKPQKCVCPAAAACSRDQRTILGYSRSPRACLLTPEKYETARVAGSPPQRESRMRCR